MTAALTVFVTGGCGFLGRAVAERFRSLGHHTRGVDLTPDPQTSVVAGDVTTDGDWAETVVGCDVVIHTAAVVSNAADPDTAWRGNVLGTSRVVEAAADAGARFVHFSSVRAFSDLGYSGEVTEDDPVRVDGNPYVDTKIASEQVVLQAHAAGRIDATIVRPGDVYGPGSRPWTLLPLQFIRRNQFVLPAMGKGLFSPVYVDDLVSGVVLAATRAEASGEVFVLTGDQTVTCAEFFGHYYRMLGKHGPPVIPTAAARPLAHAVWGASRLARRPTEFNPASMLYFTRSVSYSNAKARRVLGFGPQVDLREGMTRTEQWLRDTGQL